MSITKNKNEVRLKSGNNFKVYYNSAWITLGHIVSGKISVNEASAEVTWADGEINEYNTTRKCTVEVVLGQFTKEIDEKLDSIGASSSVKLYYYNGTANSKHMEIYVPEAKLFRRTDVEMSGNAHQVLGLVFSVQAQTSAVSVTPNSDLPSDKYATGASPVTGTNRSYIILETSV